MALVEVNWKPDDKTLRQFGVAGLLILGAIAGLSWLTGMRADYKLPAVLAFTTAIGVAVAPRAPIRIGAPTAAIFALLAALMFGLQLRTSPVALLVIACGFGVVGLAAPRQLRPAYVGLSMAGYPIGTTVGYVIFGLIYFVIFTPIAIVFRAMGRDALNRKFDPSATTYWQPRRPIESSKRYFRQF